MPVPNLLARFMMTSDSAVRLEEVDPGHDGCAGQEGHRPELVTFVPAAERPPVDFYDRLLVAPGRAVGLGEIDPAYHGGYDSASKALPQTKALRRTMQELQYLMHAENRHSLLIVIQGIDASGKDGAIRNILAGMNPAGCHIVNFRQPTRVELDHDFLWRVHPHLPAKGQVSIFNRSHYEDVLIVRVHQMDQKTVWAKRYDLINDFERLLVSENNTTVLKFFLYISKDEQLRRFRQRLEDPARHWKISEDDYREREFWDRYIEVFQDMLNRTSTAYAPWFVIPSDCKCFRDLAISQIVVRTLEDLGMKSPDPAVDIGEILRRYHSGTIAGSK